MPIQITQEITNPAYNEISAAQPQLPVYRSKLYSDDPIFMGIYITYTSLLIGTNINADNWILLLTKAMSLVTGSSNTSGIDKQQKINLCVNMVLQYLDDYTDLADDVIFSIKTSVETTCISILNNTGTLQKTNKVASKSVTTQLNAMQDTDLLITPMQAITQLISKLETVINMRNMNASELKREIPELIIIGISTVNKYSHMTNLEKKNIIIEVFKNLVDRYIKNQEHIHGVGYLTKNEQAGLSLIINSMPFMIDTLVAVAKGKADYKFEFSDITENASNIKTLLCCLVSCMTHKRGTNA